MIEALDITSTKHEQIFILKELLKNAEDDVAKGIPLVGFTDLTANIFPPMVNHMIKIGEETGNIEIYAG
jgi:type IV pilus assembly protein PilC